MMLEKVLSIATESLGNLTDAIRAPTAHLNDTNSSDPTPQADQFRNNNSSSNYLFIAGVMAVLGSLLLILAWNMVRQRRRVVNTDSESPTGRSMAERIQRRYETVEHWLISKQVQPHDNFCAAVVSKFDHHRKVEQAHCKESAPQPPSDSEICPSLHNATAEFARAVDAGTDTEEPSSGNFLPRPDDNVRECPICMSDLQLGQIVSWSANENCSHGTPQ